MENDSTHVPVVNVGAHSACVDCGGQTYCDVQHGMGHDHDGNARLCSHAVRHVERDDAMTYVEGLDCWECGASGPHDARYRGRCLSCMANKYR